MRVGGRDYYDLPNVTRFLESGGEFLGKVPFSKNGRTLAICSPLFPILKREQEGGDSINTSARG
jgi:hypothetical protein